MRQRSPISRRVATDAASPDVFGQRGERRARRVHGPWDYPSAVGGSTYQSQIAWAVCRCEFGPTKERRDGFEGVKPGHDDRGLRYPSGTLAHRLALQADLGLETFKITKDRGDRERASGAPHAHQTVLIGDIAFDDEIVPTLGMPYVIDRNVVMLA